MTRSRFQPGSLFAFAASLFLVLANPTNAFAATTVVWPAAQIPGIETSESPVGEDFKGRFYVATLSTDVPEDSRIQLSSTPLSGAAPVWTTQLFIPGSDSNSSIAIKEWKNKLWLAFRAQNHKIYVTSSSNGTTWAPYASIAGSDDNELGRGGVSLKGVGSKLYLAARDVSGQVEVASRTESGSWSAQRLVPGLTTPYTPALTEFKNKLTLVIVGADGLVHLNTSSNGTSWGSWINAPGFGLGGENNDVPLVANRGPGATVYNDKLHVAVRIGDFDTEDSRHMATYNGKKWTPWDPTPPFGPTLNGEPSITTADDDLFIVTQDWDASTVTVERVH